MYIDSNIALITINETLIVQLVSFLIFMYLLNRVMIRPLRNSIDQRDQFVADIKNDIDNADMELKNVTDLIKEGEIAIRKEAQEMRDKLEASGKQEASKKITAAAEEIAKLKETAEIQINDQIINTRKQLKDEFEVLSVTVMEKILDRRLAK